MSYEDIIYEKKEGIGTIVINRPDVYNAFRQKTLYEMIHALTDAWNDRECGVVVITGAGNKAFCTGGDQREKKEPSPGAENFLPLGTYVAQLHYTIRNIPKPVIAAVNGYAIGGGNVLHVVCDITIASEDARFGQVGPKVGSVDAGMGTAYLSRIIGEKKAREMWFLCRQYSAEEAFEMGLVNKVVPHEKLMEEAEAWAREMLIKSPTALKLAKYSFNADSDNIYGISRMGLTSLELFHTTDEAMEGIDSFLEKRIPDFTKFRK